MIWLILFLLIVVLVVYAVFFLFFKLIWILFKKNRNLWPLILAGISTILSGLLMVGLIAWGISRIVAPFRPLQQRIVTQPEPVYGTHTYIDPDYHFTFQFHDGMDFSEWITWFTPKIKVGIDTNEFKKDAAGRSIKGTGVYVILIYQTENINSQQPFQQLEEFLEENARISVSQHTPLVIDGQPAYYVTGTAYTNRGPLPFWGQALYQNNAIIYTLAIEDSRLQRTSHPAQAIVQSLRPYPTPADTQLQTEQKSETAD